MTAELANASTALSATTHTATTHASPRDADPLATVPTETSQIGPARAGAVSTGEQPTLAPAPPPGSLQALQDAVVAFSDARDWGRFHRPGELAKALSVEAGELLQLFLWVDDSIPGGRAGPAPAALADEVADVAICLLNLCHRAGIDLTQAVEHKLARNAAKYPVEKVRGKARKYNEYGAEDDPTE